MTNAHGDFIWYELLTSDADAAGDFYGRVVGWTAVPSGQPGMDYRFFFAGDGSDANDGVGGFMAITDEMAAGGARPAWVGYIAVDDVDAAVTTITSSGGSVLMPAMDLDGVGRMAMVADPQGAPFYVMRGTSDETSQAFAKYAPKLGHCAWNELATADPEGAKSFYNTIFGWVKDGEMDMGPMGKYEFIKSDVPIGAIMPKMPEMPVSAWGYYFRVANIDAAVAAVKASGGTILMEPVEIPGGEFSFNAMDPQGAAFGLVGPRT
jgi:predicted enzyme related to lactoylglutathione lyase